MPQMTGTEFLALARRCQPEAIRIMLTGYAETQAIIEAINQSEIYRFVNKPWDEGDLRVTIRRALDHHALTRQNRELMAQIQAQNAELAALNQGLEARVAERTAQVEAQRDQLKALYERLDGHFVDTLRVLAGLLELRDIHAGGHSRRVAASARWLAEHLKLPPAEIREIEIAATLHDIGKIGLPDTLAGKPKHLWSEAEQRLAQQAEQDHPLVGQALLAGIEDWQPVGRIIRHHHERYDGLGHPDRLEGEAIPLGSRIIAVADAYDRGMFTQTEALRRNASSVVDQLKRNAGYHFDPKVVLAFLGYLALQARQRTERGEVKVMLPVLEPGMMLSRDLYTPKGVLLMASDTPLLGSHIERLRKFDRLESVGPIYVYQVPEYP